MSLSVSSKSTTDSLDEFRRAIQKRLAAVRRRLRWQLLLEGFAWGIAIAVGLTAVSLITDQTFRPDRAVRVALLAVGAGVVVYVAVRCLRDPLFMRLDDLDLAELLDRRQRGLGQRLTTVLQLPTLLQQDPHTSPSMIRAAVRDEFEALGQIDLHAVFNSDRRRNAALAIIGLLALVAVFCAVNPATAGLWARRWFGGANVRWPQKSYLIVTGLGDGNSLRVPSGEAVTIQVESNVDFQQIEGGWRLSGRGEPLFVEGATRPTSQSPENVSLRLMLGDGTRRIGNFSKFATGQYRYELPPITKPAEISITGGDDWLGPIRIEPIERPSVEILKILATTPGKAEPDVIRADDAEQQLLFQPTTKLELQLTSTQPLANAKMSVSGSNDPAKDLERMDDRTYRMNWEVKEAVTFEYQLHGKEGGLNSKPYFLTLGLLNDRPPRLTIRSSGVGRRVTPVARIPLNLRVLDDFGVAKLALEMEDIRLVDQKPTTNSRKPLEENLQQPGQKLQNDVEREPTLALAEYNLVPGASIRVKGTASDACVLGEQSAESRWLAFQIVSSEELFYEILTRQREQRAKLAKAIETAKGQLDSIRRLESTKEAGAIVRVHQAIARQVFQISGVLNGTLQEMTLNDVGAPAARTLLDIAIVKPLYELHGTGFTDLRTKLDTLTTGQVIDEEKREDANQSQTEVVEKMQRILDKMSEWESFVDAVNQLRSIIKTETEIHETTEKTQKEQIKEVFDEE